MSGVSTGTYPVNCLTCGEKYNALTAEWCGCLYKDRTLKCPTCGNCFCKAAPSVKRQFWAAAPDAMWGRKREEQKKAEGRFVNPEPGAVKRPFVLIVEDEKEIQGIAIAAVEALGYGVALARNGEEGLQLVKEYKPDLVLTDAMMPKLDGREMALRIKSDPETAATKIIVMTSLYTDPRYKYEALKEFKVDTYVSKPLEPQLLRELLQKMLG